MRNSSIVEEGRSIDVASNIVVVHIRNFFARQSTIQRPQHQRLMSYGVFFDRYLNVEHAPPVGIAHGGKALTQTSWAGEQVYNGNGHFAC